MLPLLLLFAVAAVLLGIHSHSEGLPVYWNRALLRDVLPWLAGLLVVGAVLHWRLPQQAHALLPLCILLYLAGGLGSAALLATLLFLLACWSLGRAALLLALPDTVPDNLSLSLLVGMALQLALAGALLHFPVNHAWLHLLLHGLSCLVLLRASQRHELRQRVSRWLSPANSLRQVPFVWYAPLVILSGAVARYALFPSIGGDDNALHLRLWTELSWLRYYSFDVKAQVWAVAPFALDLLHALPSLVAGADARGSLNLALYLLLLRQLWCILAAWELRPADSLLLLALFASTPLLGNLLITLQTELFMAVLAATGVRLLLETGPACYRAQAVALLAIAALAAATKLPGAVLGLLLLLPLTWRLWPWRDLLDRDRSTRSGTLYLPGCALLLAAFAWLALHSYLVAWVRTGNPLFPLYNGIFLSPWNDPVNFSDGRWIHGFSLDSFVNAFFATSAHYEARDFTAGFQYLVLLPPGLVLLLRQWPAARALPLLTPLLGFGLVMFATTQYWRYLFPVMPLATLAMGALLTPLLSRTQQTAVRLAIGSCIMLNLWFYPGISYLLALPPGASYTEAGRAQAIIGYLPEQALNTWVNQHAGPGTRVLYQPERPLGATLYGDPWYPMWYAPARRDMAAGIDSPAALAATLQAEDIGFVIWNMGFNSPPPPGSTAILHRHLAHQGLPLTEYNQTVLYALPPTPPVYEVLLRTGDLPLAPAQHLAPLAVSGGRALRISGRLACAQAGQVVVLTLVTAPATTALERRLTCRMAPVDYLEAFALPAGTQTVELSLQGPAGSTLEQPLLELH